MNAVGFFAALFSNNSQVEKVSEKGAIQSAVCDFNAAAIVVDLLFTRADIDEIWHRSANFCILKSNQKIKHRLSLVKYE